MQNGKIDKNVKIMYIVSLVILVIRFGIKIFNSLRENKLFLLSMCSFGLSGLFIICFILFIIFTIINFQNNKNKTIKTKAILMIGSLLLIMCTYYAFPNTIIETKEEKFLKQITELANKVKEDKSNKFVYKLEDLQEIDKNLKKSPYGLAYQESSYISKFNDNIYVCISDGDNIVWGELDNLEYDDPIIFNDCEFNFSNENAAIYILYKLNEKYGKEFEVTNCERTTTPIPFESGDSLNCSAKEKNSDDTFHVGLDDNFNMSDEYTLLQIELLLKQQMDPIIQGVLKDNDYKFDLFSIYEEPNLTLDEITLDNIVNKFTIDLNVDVSEPTTEKQMNLMAQEIGNWMKENQIYGNVFFRKYDADNYLLLTIDLEVDKDNKINITKGFERETN